MNFDDIFIGAGGMFLAAFAIWGAWAIYDDYQDHVACTKVCLDTYGPQARIERHTAELCTCEVVTPQMPIRR